MSSAAFRRAEPGDRDAVWRLHILVLEDANARPASGGWDDDLHNIEGKYLDVGGEFIVGFVEDALVAMGGLKRRSEQVAEITRMRVHPEHQRQGVGQEMLSLLEARAVSLGVRALVLETTTVQRGARRLYEKNGYTVTGESKVGAFDVVRYRKALDATAPGDRRLD